MLQRACGARLSGPGRLARLLLLSVLCLGVLAPSPAGGTSRPRVAIVFEHAGGSLAEPGPIYAMHRPFGLGIFPHMRYSAQIACEAHPHGLVPMLHLDGVDPSGRCRPA